MGSGGGADDRGGGVTLTAWLVVATAALAVFTATMAWETRKTAKAAVDDIEQGQAALLASTMPMLVGVDDHQGGQGDIRFPDGESWHVSDIWAVDISSGEKFIHCAITLRNVGAGTAIVTGIGLNFGSAGRWHGAMSSAIVPVGDHTRFTFALPHNRADISDDDRRQLLDGNATLTASYTDAYGRQALTSVAHISRSNFEGQRGEPRVRQTGVYRDGEDDPFVMSGPSGD